MAGTRRNSTGGGAAGGSNAPMTAQLAAEVAATEAAERTAAAAASAASAASAAAAAFAPPTTGPQALRDALALVGGADFSAANEGAHKLRMRFVRGVLLLLQIGDPLGDPAATWDEAVAGLSFDASPKAGLQLDCDLVYPLFLILV